ncbi:uncharacterized protein RSE6_01906 [Rhynchosporium secalis]|uniref:3CxxC-type domain-containing protein n=1 Tax=Rhynchosporium secalis TaxID=38038 RepID=A0A1E1LYZ6_RHYSE|nr:uncharacterized protein RSE6_01906 [Rhynchosporium secalis]
MSSSLVMAQTLPTKPVRPVKARKSKKPKSRHQASPASAQPTPELTQPTRQPAQPAQPAQSPPQSASTMYPLLHDNVSRLLEIRGHPFTFYPVDTEHGCVRSYDTAIKGKFKCLNRECLTKAWSSKVVAITIREFTNKQYNALVYNQRCDACSILGEPKLDDTYAERIAYRLLKWSGVKQEEPVFNKQSRGPHLSPLCEGCKAGRCAEGNRNGGLEGLATRLGNVSLGGN